MKRLLLFTALFLLLTSCGSAPPAEASPPAGTEETAQNLPLEPPEEPPPPAEQSEGEKIAAFLETLTLEEKVGQLFFVRCPAENAAADVQTYRLGGYILFGRDTKDKTANDLVQAIAGYQAAADIPLLIGVDEEGGSVVRVSSNPHIRSTKFPSARKVWEAGPEALAASTREKNQLLQALGFNVNLAPVADVSTNPADFIYPRTIGEDAQTTAAYVETVVNTMSSGGLGSVLKHFPGYGNNADTHTGIAIDKRPMETFTENDFLPFQSGIAAGDGKTAVLVSHNLVTCMDAGLPASLSPAVHQVIRETLKFDGVIMTDDLAMDAVAAYAEDGAVSVMAVAAGNDLIITTDYRTQIPKVIEAVQSGALEESVIDAACARVLQWKQNLGLLPVGLLDGNTSGPSSAAS